MSMTMDESIKRWTAKRKTALVIEIIRDKTTVAEASRSFDLTPSEIEGWIEDAKRGMENSLRANPLDWARRCKIRPPTRRALASAHRSFASRRQARPDASAGSSQSTPIVSIIRLWTLSSMQSHRQCGQAGRLRKGEGGGRSTHYELVL